LSLSILYAAYFGSLRTIATILIAPVSMLILYVYFRKTSSPSARSWSLGLMLLSSIFLWLFIAISLILCYTFSELYEYQLELGIRAVFGRAILLSIAGGLPFSLLLRHISPKITLAKVKGLHPPPEAVAAEFESVARKLGIQSAELQLSESVIPVSFTSDTDKPIVVISEKLLSLLKEDELEAVMAHELAHIKNSDTTLKALVTGYRTVLPIDPVIRLVEAAFHREREMAADETAAKATQKPLSLASALLKIYEAFPTSHLPTYGTLSILSAGSTLMSRNPPIHERVNQLIRLAQSYH
jgi:Zn-dependent protease with chaperone function